jgi:alkylation response protein AidB-like acyl-CoA dehydrogenase
MFYLQEQRNIIGMLFPGSREYHSLLESIGDFFEKEILPDAKKIDQEAMFPRRSLEKIAEKGIMAIPFPKQYGGLGLPYPLFAAALEMLAKACANTALHVDVQNMACEGIRLFGSERLKKEYLLKNGLTQGKKLIAFALTEPCCGSDAKSLRTTATLSGNSYLLNGSKTLITNPGEADYVLVFARADKGISSFIVPAGAPGFDVRGEMQKLGFRGNKLSAIQIKDCAVPRENLLGEEGKGIECAKQILNVGRLSIAAMGVGIAQAAYDKALAYSKKRKISDGTVSDFQMTRKKLADMATGISAARLLTYYAAMLIETGAERVSQISQAKLFSSEMALRVCDEAIQLHGGYGYTDGFDVHRHWRDARLLTIGEGTSEVLRLLIARLELKERE